MRILNYFAQISALIKKRKKTDFSTWWRNLESNYIKQQLYSNFWSNAAQYDLLTSLPKCWDLCCFAERKRRGFLWHCFTKNIVLSARIMHSSAPCNTAFCGEYLGSQEMISTDILSWPPTIWLQWRFAGGELSGVSAGESHRSREMCSESLARVIRGLIMPLAERAEVWFVFWMMFHSLVSKPFFHWIDLLTDASML